MLTSFKNAWRIIADSIRVFKKYPQFLLPLLAQQIFSALIILYLFFGTDDYSLAGYMWLLFASIFSIAFLLSYSCLILLELIEQIETGNPANIIKALTVATKRDLIKSIPIVFVWTIVWFILLILQALLSKKKSEKKQFTAENVAKVLADYHQETSLGHDLLSALEKGIRMIVFLILPSIAWENQGFVTAMKRGIKIFRGNFKEFASGFILSTAVEILIFLPAGIIFKISEDTTIPLWVWVITIFYTFFAWSYTIYTEQMFSAMLFMWHLKWENELRNNPNAINIPKLSDIKKPSLLDENHDLLEVNSATKNII